MGIRDEIDWQYMRNFISAIEKRVLKDMGYSYTKTLLPWWISYYEEGEANDDYSRNGGDYRS